MKVAAVIYGMGEADGVDAMLTALASRLRREGVRLAGTVQHNRAQPCSPCSDMIIEDLSTGPHDGDINTPECRAAAAGSTRACSKMSLASSQPGLNGRLISS